MSSRLLRIEIVTPDRVVAKDTATVVAAPGVLGSFGVLSSHAPMLSELATGLLRYTKEDGEDVRFAVAGGFFQVFQNAVTVLADAAERSDEINTDRARAAAGAARETLSSATGAARLEAEASLARAQNRLRIAGG